MKENSNAQKEKIIIHADPDIQDLIAGFLENRRLELVQVESDLQAGRLEAIRDFAHRLKGSGGSYGFDRLTQIGAEMETAVVHNEAAKIRTLLNEMDDYLKRVEVVYGE